MRETDTHCFFYKGEFSQWAIKFMTDRHGMDYNCCEQYMMFHKAMLFSDREIAEKILETDSPYEQKKLGRQVRDFDVETWNNHRFHIVWEGNMYKFTQHGDLQEKLCATYGKILVEASPVDKVWGVGLAEGDDRILDPNNWQGENLLGKVLNSVRDAIVNGM